MPLNSPRLAVVIIGLAGLQAIATGQQPPPATPSFRSGVQLVLVDVVVRDEGGRLVTNLTKNDFEIEDEGEPQTLASFASVSLSSSHTIANDTTAANLPVTDRVGSNHRQDGRLIVFLISDPFIAFNDTGYLRDLLHRFVDRHMGDDDQVAIWPITNHVPRQEFTNDRARLDTVSDRVQGTAGGIPALPSQVLVSLDGVLRGMERITSRRKVVILLGGEVLGPEFIGTPLYEESLRLAAAANVGIYPISVTGVAGFSDVVGSRQPRAARVPLGLNFLAEETGGVVANRNDVDNALARVQEDAGSYYLIGFSPTVVNATPNRLRRLTVKVHRARTIVQARHGYIPLPEKDVHEPAGAAVPLQDVMRDPLPSSDLPLRIHAGCFSDGKNGDIVLVTLGIDAPPDLLADDALEYRVAGANAFDRVLQEARGESTIPRATLPHDIEVVSAIDLPPGLSTIRAVVRINNGLTGSVSLNVDVPRLNERLAMSDIELAPMTERTVVAGKPPAFITEHLPKPVSAERTFDAADTLAIYGEVYPSRGPSTVTAVATIRNMAGQVQRRVPLTLAPVDRKSLSGSSPLSYSTQFDFRGLDDGAYMLGVEVVDNEGHVNAKRIAFQLRRFA